MSLMTGSRAAAVAPIDVGTWPSSISGPLMGPSPDEREDLAAHRLRFPDQAADISPADLLEAVAAAGLRGCGGAGFPTATKLAAVRDNGIAAGLAPVAVANAEEGEPGSAKDRYLLRHRPHLILDGLTWACRIIGAQTAYVYVSDRDGAASVRAAVGERAADIEFQVVEVDHAYVAGEESALVRYVNGGPALPTTKPPRAFQSGIGGVPTFVANAETLAHVAAVAAGYRAGTRLITLSGGGAPAAVREVPVGSALRELIAAHLADARTVRAVRSVRAILFGGLFGGIHQAGALDVELEHESLAAAGTSLGCGAIRLLGPDECPVAVVADALAYLAEQSSRQCGVCVSGTRALADTLARLSRGEGAEADIAALDRWAVALPGRGACALLDAAARLAGSLARSFPELLAAHLQERTMLEPCPVDPGCHVHANWGVRPPCPGCAAYQAETASPDYRPGDALRVTATATASETRPCD